MTTRTNMMIVLALIAACSSPTRPSVPDEVSPSHAQGTPIPAPSYEADHRTVDLFADCPWTGGFGPEVGSAWQPTALVDSELVGGAPDTETALSCLPGGGVKIGDCRPMDCQLARASDKVPPVEGATVLRCSGPDLPSSGVRLFVHRKEVWISEWEKQSHPFIIGCL